MEAEMQNLTYEQLHQKNYDAVVDELREKFPEIKGVAVDVTPVDADEIKLTIGEHRVHFTPEQCVDLMQALRRAVVKVKPAALHPKRKG
jgi:DNA-directed RNA polymerase subunit F